MKINKVNESFTYFGNFSKLIQKAEKIKETFSDFAFVQHQEQSPNGIPAPVYRLTKVNYSITIRVFRIDIERAIRDNDTLEDFLSYTEDVCERLSKLDQLLGNRVAYSNTEFVQDDNKEILSKLNEMFNVANVFETAADEFQIRLNHVSDLGNEKINSIIVLQDGSVTHNATGAIIPVMFINKDVNTVITSKTFRFTISRARTLLPDLIEESNKKTNVIISRL